MGCKGFGLGATHPDKHPILNTVKSVTYRQRVYIPRRKMSPGATCEGAASAVAPALQSTIALPVLARTAAGETGPPSPRSSSEGSLLWSVPSRDDPLSFGRSDTLRLASLSKRETPRRFVLGLLDEVPAGSFKIDLGASLRGTCLVGKAGVEAVAMSGEPEEKADNSPPCCSGRLVVEGVEPCGE